MDAVSLVKEACKQKKISISKLERDCDFSNGYISKVRGYFPVDKAKKISERLGIDISLLIGIEEQTDGYYLDNETAQLAQEMFEDPDMRALFHLKRNMDPERFAAHKKMMQDMYRLEHPEDDYDFGE